MSNNQETPMFARAQGAAEKVELRGLAPVELVQALDAMALSEDQDRNSYVVAVLHSHVREQLRKASLVHRVLRGNALLTEAAGGSTE